MKPFIDSAKRIFIAILTVGLSVLYFSSQKANNNYEYETKSVLSALYLLYNAFLDRESKEFLFSNYPKFSDIALDEFLANQNALLDAIISQEDDSKIEELRTNYEAQFGDGIEINARVSVGISASFSPSKTCEVAIIQPDGYFFFHVISNLYYSSIFEAYSRNVRIGWLDISCLPKRLMPIHMIYIPSKSGKEAQIALPEKLFSYLSESVIYDGDLRPFLLDNDVRERLVPSSFSRYVSLNGEYILIDSRAILVMILRNLERFTYKEYSIDKIEYAFEESYREYTEKTSVFGLNVPSEYFIRASPLIMFIFTFYYWRILRKIRSTSGLLRENDDLPPWMALDTDDLLGLVGAWTWAMTPLIVTVGDYLLYPSAFGAVLVIWGYEISPVAILNWDFPEALGPGWYGFDMLAYFTLLFAVVHFLIVFLATREATRLVNENKGFLLGSYVRNRVYRLQERLDKIIRR